MTQRTEQEIVSAWIMNNETFWAWEFIDNACRDNPELGWHYVLAILRATDSPKVIESLGAGPLEDLLANHGPYIIDRCLSLAATDAKFQRCLASTWQNAMESDIWARVCLATNRNSTTPQGAPDKT